MLCIIFRWVYVCDKSFLSYCIVRWKIDYCKWIITKEDHQRVHNDRHYLGRFKNCLERKLALFMVHYKLIRPAFLSLAFFPVTNRVWCTRDHIVNYATQGNRLPSAALLLFKVSQPRSFPRPLRPGPRTLLLFIFFFLFFPLTYEEAGVLKRFSGFRGISRGLFLESCSRGLRIDGRTGFMKRDGFWICSLRSYVSREIFFSFFLQKIYVCDVLIWIDIIQCEPICVKDTRGENNRAFVK